MNNLQTAGILQTNASANQAQSNAQANSQSNITAAQNKVLTGGISFKKKSGHSTTAVINKEFPLGAMLISPEQTTVLNTQFGKVHVSKGSVAIVVSNANSLSVYNLDDTAHDSISVDVAGQTIALQPGRHITVTGAQAQGFEQVNPAQYIAYRNVQSLLLGGNLKAYKGEFNHISAIRGLEPLRNMLKSNDHAQKKVADHMLKTSAILSMLGSSGNAPYQLMTPPALTSMK